MRDYLLSYRVNVGVPIVVSLVLVAEATAGSLRLGTMGGGNLASVPAEGSLPEGTIVTITASAPPGTWLQAWSGSVPESERWTGRSSVQVTVNGDMTVTAQFGPRPPVRLFKTGGETFRAFRLSPDGRYALGTTTPVAGSYGYPAFRDRESRAVTVTSTREGQLRSLAPGGQMGIGTYYADTGAPSFYWKAGGKDTAFGGNPGSNRLFANDLSRDGTVLGCSRFIFIGGGEQVAIGTWGGSFPSLGGEHEYYVAMSGDGRLLFSIVGGTNSLVVYDRITGSRTESALPAGWSFYPYNADLNFPAGANVDGSVLVATFTLSGTQRAALYRSGSWALLPGGGSSSVYRVSGNGHVATGFSGGTGAIWKLDGAAPVSTSPSAWLAEQGGWLPPLTIRGVDDVSDDGNTVLVHEEAGGRPWPWTGYEANWIAVRPRIQQQTLTFTQPGEAVENGAPVALAATATSGLPVGFRLVSGPGRIEGNEFFPSGLGAAVIEATQAGGPDDYIAAPPVSGVVTIVDDPALAEIRFATVGSGQIGGMPKSGFVPVGMPIDLFAVPDEAAGQAFHSWLIDSQPVGGNVVSETELTRSFLFTPSNGTYKLTARFAPAQTITFTLQLEAREDVWRVPVSASASSGLAVALTLVSGPGTFADGYFYPTGPGEAVFSAQQAGDSNYAPAVEVVRTLALLPDTAAPVVELDQQGAFTVIDGPGVISGTVMDEATLVTLTVLDGSGRPVGNVTVSPGQAFEFSQLPLVLGPNQFTLRATGGRLVTEKPITITWDPDHHFRLTGPEQADEARSVGYPLEAITKGGLAGMTFEVTYAAQTMLPAVFEPSPSLALALLGVNNATPGKLRFTLATPGLPLPAGTVNLGTLWMRSRSFGTAPIASPIGLSISGVSNDEGNAITAGLFAEGKARTLQPRAHTADVNNNGRWDVGDAVLLQRFLTGLEVPQSWDHPLNDLNTSGGLDTGDVIKILRAAALMDPNIPSAAGAAQGLRNAGDENLALVILNPDAKPGSILRLQLKASALLEPSPGASFAIDFPSAWLEPEGVLPITLSSTVPPGSAQRSGQIAGPAPGLTRLTLAVSSPQTFGVAGQPIVVADVALRLRTEAAAAIAVPIRLSAGSLASADAYEIRDPARVSAVYHPQGATFAGWQASFFTLEQLADPAISGFEADPDGDGIGNGLEHLLGGNPFAAQSPRAPEVIAGSDGLVRFVFTQHPGIEDSTLVPEWTEDLGRPERWQATGFFEESSVPQADGVLVITLRASGTLAEHPNRWFRMKALRP